MKKYLLLISIFLLSTNIFSQEPYGGINIFRGGNVDFIFRSLNHISNGRSLGSAGTGYTEIYIKLDTTVGPGYGSENIVGWELTAWANTVELEASGGGPGISVADIRMHITMTEGTGTVPAASTLLTTNPSTVIASGDYGDGSAGSGGTEWKVTIAYDCAKESGTGLTGYDSDFYYTDLFFTWQEVY